MTANSKSYLSYLNELVDEYKNTYRHSTDADYSALSEEIESSHKAPNLKLVLGSELLSIRIILANVTPKTGQKKYLLLILC